MIPPAFVTAWRAQAPWPEDAQVEQDLVLSRAIVEIFRDPRTGAALAFRGGTALHKLHLAPAQRYSEDIDLVQIAAGPIGPVLDALHEILDPWLGTPRTKQGAGFVTLAWRFVSSGAEARPLRLKVEINSREHFSVEGLEERPFAVESPWFAAATTLRTYRLEEMLGTKLRALYQRRKGRDLYDLAWAVARHPDLDLGRIANAFDAYMAHGGHGVSRSDLVANLEAKFADRAFRQDIQALLAPTAHAFDTDAAIASIRRLVALLPEAIGQAAVGPSLPPRKHR